MKLCVKLTLRKMILMVSYDFECIMLIELAFRYLRIETLTEPHSEVPRFPPTE